MATYIKQCLKPVSLASYQEKYVRLGLEVTVSSIYIKKLNKTLIIIGTYRPPQSDARWFDEFSNLISETSTLGCPIVLGDVNANLLKPSEYPGKALIQCFDLLGIALPSSPTATRVSSGSSTLLDIIGVDSSLTVLSYHVGSQAASDHFPVLASIRACHSTKLEPILRRSFKKVDFNQLGNRVVDIVIPPLDSLDYLVDNSVKLDTIVQCWHQQFTTILDEVAPIKPYPMRRHISPFITAAIQTMIRRRDLVAHQLTTNSDSQPLKDELSLLRRQVKSRMRREAKNAGSIAFTNPDARQAWKFIRQVTFSEKSSECPAIDPRIINEFFGETVKSQSNDNPLTPLSCDNNTSFCLQKFTEAKIANTLQKVKINTAAGHDQIPGLLLSRLAVALSPSLTKVFNASIQAGAFPTEWKKANISAVYKGKGSKSDASSYRPISVLPVLGRILEKLVAEQLSYYCEATNSIPNAQFGFRKHSSCEQAILSALDNWSVALDEGKFVGALLVDLSKAFDTVPHQQLLQELLAVGINQAALDWFTSYLCDRKQRVIYQDVTTNYKEVTRGVPQGSCLSPLLFNIFVRDLPLNSDGFTTQFADDITHSQASKSLQDVADSLTNNFKCTKDFCDTHGLIINTAKTQLIIFKSCNKKLPEEFGIQLDDCIIKPESTVKLLGCTLDRHLTFGPHIDGVVRKCQAALGMLRRAAPYLTIELLRLCYISLVRSNIEYCSAIFAGAADTHLQKLQTVQKIAARIITGASRNAHAQPLLDSLKLEPISDRREAHILKLVDQFIGGQCNPSVANWFIPDPQGILPINPTKNKFGRTRFYNIAASLYNNSATSALGSSS